MFPPKSSKVGATAAAPPIPAREAVIVAVKAEKVIPRTTLAWALTHVVRPGDTITLLAVFPQRKTGKRMLWGFRRLKGDCHASDSASSSDQMVQISESCSQMVLQFHNQIDVRVRIKVVSATSAGIVASEARNNGTKWVILDKKLKKERKHCLEELCCNILVMKGTQPKVLRLDLESSDEVQTPFFSVASSPDKMKLLDERMRHSTPVSSPEEPCTSYTLSTGENSLSSPDLGTPTFFVYKQNPLYEKPCFEKHTLTPKDGLNNSPTIPDFPIERLITLSAASEIFTPNNKRVFWISQNHDFDERAQEAPSPQIPLKHVCSRIRNEIDDPAESSQYTMSEVPNHKQSFTPDSKFNNSIREAVSLGRTSSSSPPLCSQCQLKAPAFGKPPRQFQYGELEEATDGFSDNNFLAEGGFGLVHRGVLRDGLVVAVKQLKCVRSNRDADFCREVRVLSCAQHRNVVLLIGFCIEPNKRLLVYEYICNGSLGFYLHGNTGIELDWSLRLKIAIGTARGLRYLHEECRVGSIIHRDLRPHNILLTHDFEPLVANFGLSRLHSERKICDEELVVGRYGYLAPEYFTDSNITEKVDVYAFGLVLLDLITGQKISDLEFYSGSCFPFDNLYHWSPAEHIQLLSDKLQFLDSCLSANQHHNLSPELHAMSHAVSLCIQKDPDLRPSMSKVLRVLEGGGIAGALDVNSSGSRSGYMKGLNSRTACQSRSKHSRTFSH